MLLNLHLRRQSSLNLASRVTIKDVIPVRKSKYVQSLPSSFNMLMSHFKDEEKRQDLREKIVSTLENLEQLRMERRLGDTLQSNNEVFKDLLSSHFPRDVADQQSRKLVGKKRFAQLPVPKMGSRRPSVHVEQEEDAPEVPEVSEQIKDDPEVIEKAREKIRQKVRVVILKAKKCGNKEAEDAIKEAAKPKFKCFRSFTRKCSKDAGKESGKTTALNTARTLASLRESTRSKLLSRAERSIHKPIYVDKLLKEHLIMKTVSVREGGLSQLVPESEYAKTQEWYNSSPLRNSKGLAWQAAGTEVSSFDVTNTELARLNIKRKSVNPHRVYKLY